MTEQPSQENKNKWKGTHFSRAIYPIGVALTLPRWRIIIPNYLTPECLYPYKLSPSV